MDGGARNLGGREVADAIIEAVRSRVAGLPYTPRLTFVRVGDDPASTYYVRSKARMAARAGIESEIRALPESATQAELVAVVEELNEDDAVDGILVQLPLPQGLDDAPVLETIRPEKDVDGFHPINVGRLWSGTESLAPCTPAGLIAILDHYRIPVEGREVVIVGRSNLVGKPAAALFLGRNATVTVAHSRTVDLGAVTRRADILVSAVGRPGIITSEMVKPGAVVLDVGISRVEGRIVGDVHPGVAAVADALTPMPGGTGLVTVAMVILNTLEAAQARRGADG